MMSDEWAVYSIPAVINCNSASVVTAASSVSGMSACLVAKRAATAASTAGECPPARALTPATNSVTLPTLATLLNESFGGPNDGGTNALAIGDTKRVTDVRRRATTALAVLVGLTLFSLCAVHNRNSTS